MSVLIQTNQSVTPSAPATGKVKSYDNSLGQREELAATGVRCVLNNTKNPNWIRNSGFWFAQRQNPSAATTYSTTTSRVITADGWGITNENASTTYTRKDTVSSAESGLQGQYYGTFTKITATGKIVVSQMLEHRDALQLRGRTVRVQAWLKADSARTVCIGLAYLSTSGTTDSSPATFISAFGASSVDPTLGTNVSYIAPKSGVLGDNTTVSTNCVKGSVTTSWQRFGGVFDVPANLKNLYLLIYSDAQVTLTTGTISVAQVSLTDGMDIQDWVPLSYQQELARCQRHYNKSFSVDTLPATNVGAGTNEWRHSAPKGAATASVSPTLFYPVTMRSTSPTLTFYNPSAANAQMRDITAAADCTVTAATTSTEKGFSVGYTSAAGSATGNVMGVNWTADGEMI